MVSGSQVRNPVRFHRRECLRRTAFSRAFGIVYTCGIIALFYHHAKTLVASKTTLSFCVTLSLFVSDLVLAFLWITAQSLYVNLIRRFEFPENLKKVVKTCDLPALDVFICTADPYKEPPTSVVNTALSVMAYDYPMDKMSVYVSDDGGSALTLFAFMEAAKFATHWLPFCRDNNLMDTCPEAYFESNQYSGDHHTMIKMMYEKMKNKIEDVVEIGKVADDVVQQVEALKQWTEEFTSQSHPTVIQVLLDNNNDRDVNGHPMPTLIYLSRQKATSSPHHFKAGALNTLLRVSASISNAPIVLTLDCDMYSNDPHTPIRALCYLLDPDMNSNLGYVQFPQIFPKLNQNDTYACEFKRLFQINPLGFDNSMGPNYVGTGCFFNRQAFFGSPSSFVSPEFPYLDPTHVVDKRIKDQEVLARAHRVAACDYEINTQWGYKIGFRYGSLVEDYYTGYRMQCEGWRSVFCNPKTAAFHGDAPITLIDALNQTKRWAIGLLQVGFSRYSPLIFGIKSMGLSMGLGYSFYSFWPLWAIPLTLYAFLPPLAILARFTIFLEVSSETWSILYILLFVGAYAQDFMESALEGRISFQRWWNEQRMWMIRGVSCWLFGLIEFTLQSLGMSTHGFNLTIKLLHSEQVKKYDQQIFELGISSPLFVPLTTAAIINLLGFITGFIRLISGKINRDDQRVVRLLETLMSGFVVINCLPIYSAMVFRSEKGAKISTDTLLLATFLASCLLIVSYLFLY